MIKYFYIFILVFIVLSAKAQVVIDSTEMPVPGDTINFHTTNNLHNLNYTTTGTSYIWDFSTLSSPNEVYDTFVTVSSTNLAYLPFYGNPFDQTHKATTASPATTQSIPFVDIEFTEAFNFYKRSYSRYSMLGMGEKINGIPVPLRFDNPDVWYKFPITYNTRDTSDSEFHTTIPTIGYYGQSRHRENFVDGWGTLYLPTDTFNVIRVKSVVDYTDTIYLDTIGMGFPIKRTETEYKWFAEGFHEPVLQITRKSQYNVTARYYYYLPPDFSVNSVENTGLLEVYPNPAKENIHITLPKPNEEFTVIVSDITGREMIRKLYKQNTPEIKLNVEQLQNGLYLIGIVSASSKYSGKFLKF